MRTQSEDGMVNTVIEPLGWHVRPPFYSEVKSSNLNPLGKKGLFFSSYFCFLERREEVRGPRARAGW